MDIGGFGNAAGGDDAAEDRGDQLPLLEEVPAQDDLLGVVLIVSNGGRISGGFGISRGSCGLGWGGRGGIRCPSSGGGAGFLHSRSSGWLSSSDWRCARLRYCALRVSSARVLSFRVSSQKASFSIRLDTKTRAAPFCELSLPLTKQPPHRRTWRCSGTVPPAGRRARTAQTFPTAWSSNPVSIHRSGPPKPRFQRLSHNLAILQGTRGSPRADPASRASSSCR